MNKGDVRSDFLLLLNRRNCTNTLADSFIDKSISRIQRILRISAMERIAQVTVGTVFDGFDVPSDYLEAIEMFADGKPLTKTTLKDLLARTPYQDAPQIYTRYERNFLFWPVPPENAVLTLLYYGQFTPLVNDTDENILTRIGPEAVIYGALSYAATHYTDDRAADFEQTFLREIRDLNDQNIDQEFSGGTQQVSGPYPDAEY